MTAPTGTEGLQAGAALQCEASVPPTLKVGEPVVVTFRIRNPTPQTLYVLKWRSPFEGQPRSRFLEITRDGVEVQYQGPMIKRGDPSAGDYASVPASTADTKGEAELAIEASLAYDFSQPGTYRIAYRGPLMDATAQESEVPRPLAQHRAMPVECPEVQTTIVAP
ncbi:protease [Hyalangium gracile]|uniref:protease n=1 Tax=Hyalangium gracile TaxID=394092 RepID=UPI001CCE6534|nr:protease [Hyalangium gracile]